MPTKRFISRNGRTVATITRGFEPILTEAPENYAKPLARPDSGVVLSGSNNQTNKVSSTLKMPGLNSRNVLRKIGNINHIDPTVPTSVGKITGQGILGDIKVSKISKKVRNDNNLVLKIDK